MSYDLNDETLYPEVARARQRQEQKELLKPGVMRVFGGWLYQWNGRVWGRQKAVPDTAQEHDQ